MTSTPMSSIKRRKKMLTYGKKPSPAIRPDNLNFFDEDEDELTLSHTPAKRRKPSPRRPSDTPLSEYAVEQPKRSSKPAAVFPVRRKIDSKDAFDVPSSDEESSTDYAITTTAPRVHFSSSLVDDRHSRPNSGAPEVSNGPSQHYGQTRATGRSLSSRRHAQSPKSIDIAQGMKLSTTERLKSRRNVPHITSAQSNSLGTTSLHTDRHSSTTDRMDHGSASQRSRPSSVQTSHDMRHSPSVAAHDAHHFDGEAVPSAGSPATPIPRTRRSRSGTPISSGGSSKSEADAHEKLCLTPKQSKLWNGLLELVVSDDSAREGNGYPKRNSTGVVSNEHRTQPSKRLRMAERLGGKSASQETGQAQDSEEDESPSSSSNNSAKSIPSDPVAVTTPARTQSTQTSRLQKSSRLTYTQQRSHLAEDELADAMALSMPADTVQARHARRNQALDNAISFDIEEDEAGSQNKVKSIHELRAAGQSSRLAAKIEGLLQDIASHNDIATTRRKTALIRLATQMLDEATVKRFLQAGHDMVLLNEMFEANDSASATILVAISITMLSIDLTGHTLEHFVTALPRLLDLLEQSGDVNQIVTDRAANSSMFFRKEASAYFKLVHGCSSYWPDGQPDILSPRLLYLRALDLLARQMRRNGDISPFLDGTALSRLCSSLSDSKEGFSDTAHAVIDCTLVISILESLSISASPSSWPPEVTTAIAEVLSRLGPPQTQTNHLRFLTYRLCLNVTNDASIDHFIFANRGAVRQLFGFVTEGLDLLASTAMLASEEPQQLALQLDLIVLAIGILINLTEHSRAVRQATLEPAIQPYLLHVLSIFRTRHETAREVESEHESAGNVAYGYLAVLLANLCQDVQVRQQLSRELPGKSLKPLAEAVEEFVLHHRKVDTLNFEGEEGQEVWSSFTARLEDVLVKLRSVVDV